ncbi:PAS and ANTAR domain-containing protein [Nocardioides mesophilus]|uniref:PAS and ANTAR domain-containing protein n=1 Tax=Nocardioides mesophilus TaxID=433659 RepID=A0A7G9R8I6_9ACTN|nr:PAS and ANTAR domain-containing protein [Nocardioides mesophilus]QNN51911.1 PAS and ANTAR domain-containing protein [Nocardioides mesophilus]
MPRIGRYTYTVDTDSWWWSDTLYEIHGFRPGEVLPSTDVMLAHRHPDDAESFRAMIGAVLSTGQASSCYHRMIDAHRRELTVLTVGHGIPRGEVVREVHGYLVDLTEIRRRDSLDAVQDAVGRATEHRAVIEQAKGILMAVRNVTPQEAFELLSSHSQRVNVKLRDLAQELVDEMQTGGHTHALLDELAPHSDGGATGRPAAGD